MTLTEVVHIAGLDIEIGTQLRQRCGWCGAVLVDCDLTRIAVPVGQDPRPATWPVGALVGVIGGRDEGFRGGRIVEHTDGNQLPAECCGQLDHEITGA